MTDWRPIETAPRDEFVLAYEPSQGICIAMTYNGDRWYLDELWNAPNEPENAHMVRSPTHWMPLPPPPQ